MMSVLSANPILRSSTRFVGSGIQQDPLDISSLSYRNPLENPDHWVRLSLITHFIDTHLKGEAVSKFGRWHITKDGWKPVLNFAKWSSSWFEHMLATTEDKYACDWLELRSYQTFQSIPGSSLQWIAPGSPSLRLGLFRQIVRLSLTTTSGRGSFAAVS